MRKAMLLAGALFCGRVEAAGSGPGRLKFGPGIREEAVIRPYDLFAKKVLPDIDAWTNTTALAKFFQAMQVKRSAKEEADVADDLMGAAERRRAYGRWPSPDDPPRRARWVPEGSPVSRAGGFHA
jgi:hypothetical protein